MASVGPRTCFPASAPCTRALIWSWGRSWERTAERSPPPERLHNRDLPETQTPPQIRLHRAWAPGPEAPRGEGQGGRGQAGILPRLGTGNTLWREDSGFTVSQWGQGENPES